MSDGGPARKLTAILAADVVAYSRLMAADEEGTVRRLRAYRAIADGLIDAHHGRVFGTAGDSVIAEFGSPVEAVRCALEIQRQLESNNAEHSRPCGCGRGNQAQVLGLKAVRMVVVPP